MRRVRLAGAVLVAPLVVLAGALLGACGGGSAGTTVVTASGSQGQTGTPVQTGPSGPSGEASGEPKDLASARAVWDAAAIADYRLRVVQSCFCTVAGTLDVVVREGRPVTTSWIPVGRGVTPPGRPSAQPSPPPDGTPTSVEALLDLVDKEQQSSAKVDVTFDGHGVPTSIAADRILNAVDDEEQWTVTFWPGLVPESTAPSSGPASVPGRTGPTRPTQGPTAAPGTAVTRPAGSGAPGPTGATTQAPAAGEPGVTADCVAPNGMLTACPVPSPPGATTHGPEPT